MLKIAEYTQKALELRNRAIKAFNAAGLDIRINENEDTGNIKLVFAGQYSAGKSSILKMLTGRNDIAIGAGITTQKAHSYECFLLGKHTVERVCSGLSPLRRDRLWC